MVCVPCFIIPVLLYIWHKFVQPILLRYWNPWEKKDAHGNVIKAGPEFPFECKGGVCPYPGAKGITNVEKDQSEDKSPPDSCTDKLLETSTEEVTATDCQSKKQM